MASVRARCLRVPKRDAERARQWLAATGALRRELLIKREGDFVLIPVNDGAYRRAPVEAGGWEMVESDFEAAPRRPSSYRELVELPEGLRRHLPRSFDVIGKVILIKIPEELSGFERELGRALLEARPECASVARDRGVTGEERVRRLEVIAGDENLETVHVEHGARFCVDPSRVYFSPRLATERARVAGLVRDGELVVDLFAGVGPFSIQLARRSRPSRVVAVDINPVAIEYLKKNIRLNRVPVVEPVLDDARRIPGRLPPADRVIMNLPHRAMEFLDVALALLRPGGTVHMYEIARKEEISGRLESLRTGVERLGRRLLSVSHRRVRSYSPSELHLGMDICVD